MAMRRVQFTAADGSVVSGTEVDALESTDRWCEYKLEDGTLMRAKPIIATFVRIDGKYDPEGNPFYAMKGSVQSVLVSAPAELQKKDSA